LSKQKQTKAFITQCSASDSYSLIKVAHLESLGILEGSFECDGFIHMQQKRYKVFWGDQSCSDLIGKAASFQNEILVKNNIDVR